MCCWECFYNILFNSECTQRIFVSSWPKYLSLNSIGEIIKIKKSFTNEKGKAGPKYWNYQIFNTHYVSCDLKSASAFKIIKYFRNIVVNL